MTLSAIRARLYSLSPSKLAEIEAVSPCAAKILGDVGAVLDIVEAARAFVLDPRIIQWEAREIELNRAFSILEPSIETPDRPGLHSGG